MKPDMRPDTRYKKGRISGTTLYDSQDHLNSTVQQEQVFDPTYLYWRDLVESGRVSGVDLVLHQPCPVQLLLHRGISCKVST